MSGNMHRSHEVVFKAKVVLKGEKTMAELSIDYGAHRNQIRQWGQKLVDELPGVFSDRRLNIPVTKATLPEWLVSTIPDRGFNGSVTDFLEKLFPQLNIRNLSFELLHDLHFSRAVKSHLHRCLGEPQLPAMPV